MYVLLWCSKCICECVNISDSCVCVCGRCVWAVCVGGVCGRCLWAEWAHAQTYIRVFTHTFRAERFKGQLETSALAFKHACVYLRTHSYVYLRTHSGLRDLKGNWRHLLSHSNMHTCIYAHIHTCIYAHIQGWEIQRAAGDICSRIQTCMRVFTHTFIRVFTHTFRAGRFKGQLETSALAFKLARMEAKVFTAEV